MPKDIFQFKEFQIAQDRCAMKVGTDALLLGAWVDLSGKTRALDIGTGTGVLALMCAQRNAELKIEAVELDNSASEQASENFQKSPWRERVRAHHIDFGAFQSKNKYDLLISNPPYFAPDNQTNDASRDQARQQDSLDPNTLFRKAAELAAPSARFALVYPFDQRSELLQAGLENGWFLARSAEVLPAEGLPPKRVLIEFSRTASPLSQAETIVLRNADGSFHADYKALTRDFHTIF